MTLKRVLILLFLMMVFSYPVLASIALFKITLPELYFQSLAACQPYQYTTQAPSFIKIPNQPTPMVGFGFKIIGRDAASGDCLLQELMDVPAQGTVTVVNCKIPQQDMPLFIQVRRFETSGQGSMDLKFSTENGSKGALKDNNGHSLPNFMDDPRYCTSQLY
jgi:hypothetical protein